jgi:hypothetical protein
MKGLKRFLCLGALFMALVFSSCPPPVSNDIENTGQDETEKLPEWKGSLVGTSWGWENAFNGWMVLEFTTESDCTLTFTNSTFQDDTPLEYTYSYNPGTNTWTIPTQGTFSVGENKAYISFAQWRGYPHGAVFNRIK